MSMTGMLMRAAGATETGIISEPSPSDLWGLSLWELKSEQVLFGGKYNGKRVTVSFQVKIRFSEI